MACASIAFSDFLGGSAYPVCPPNRSYNVLHPGRLLSFLLGRNETGGGRGVHTECEAETGIEDHGIEGKVRRKDIYSHWHYVVESTGRMRAHKALVGKMVSP